MNQLPKELLFDQVDQMIVFGTLGIVALLSAGVVCGASGYMVAKKIKELKNEDH